MTGRVLSEMTIELYIDSRDIEDYNAGKEICAYNREYGITSTTKAYVPASEIRVSGAQLYIQHKGDE